MEIWAYFQIMPCNLKSPYEETLSKTLRTSKFDRYRHLKKVYIRYGLGSLNDHGLMKVYLLITMIEISFIMHGRFF